MSLPKLEPIRRRDMKARVVKVIVHEFLHGQGIEGDPVRRVYQISSLDGAPLALLDPQDGHEAVGHSSAVGQLLYGPERVY